MLNLSLQNNRNPFESIRESDSKQSGEYSGEAGEAGALSFSEEDLERTIEENLCGCGRDPGESAPFRRTFMRLSGAAD